jgi:hypothetical protein
VVKALGAFCCCCCCCEPDDPDNEIKFVAWEVSLFALDPRDEVNNETALTEEREATEGCAAAEGGTYSALKAVRLGEATGGVLERLTVTEVLITVDGLLPTDVFGLLQSDCGCCCLKTTGVMRAER